MPGRVHHIARAIAALLAAGAVLLAVPTVASAACSASVRADVRATSQLLGRMAASGAAGREDARVLASRARRSCADARPARVIVMATARLGVPTQGRRARVLGLDLVGMPATPGPVWRRDLARNASRASGARSARAAAPFVAALRAASFGRAAVSWSADPTTFAWTPGPQSGVVALLARGRTAGVRALARPGIRAFAVGVRPAALGRLPLLEHLRVANRVALAARAVRGTSSLAASRSVAVRAMVRIRASQQRAWSRVGGQWSSLATHRTLVAQAGLLVRLQPHAPTAPSVQRLRDALRLPATLDFGALPRAAFYPWPRDGAFDTQAVTVDVDKPGSVSLLVYGPDDALVRTVEREVDPGRVTLSWDGASTAGTTLPAGEYRYNVEVRDRAGKRVRVPGLEQFTVARDQTPPTIVSATARLVGSGSSRRVVVGWNVTEVHSPQVVTWLLLGSGAQRRSIRLHDSLQRATVRKPVTLPAGTWRATVVFIDGSGNRVQQAAGSFVVR